MNAIVNKRTQFLDLGLKDYKEALDIQTAHFQEIVNLKINNRDLQPHEQRATKNYLIFCEHPHVFTLGKIGEESHLLVNEESLKSIQASFYHSNRGGDITYHGPGQIVGYPIFDLENFYTDIHRYMRSLEEAVIQTLQEYGIKGGRIPGLTGVWIDADNTTKARKICALGVKTSRWVTMHGFAFNVNTDLRYFDYIVPCGITDKAVTSLHRELGKEVKVQEVGAILKEKIREQFEVEWL